MSLLLQAMIPLRAFEWRTLPPLMKSFFAGDWRIAPWQDRSDRWLERWLPLVHERSRGLPVLELGCGRGEDTKVLAAAGLHVKAIDLSPSMIAKARAEVPTAEFQCQDIRDPFPLQTADVVVASLSLHYFSWSETLAIAQRIRSTLHPSGVLLCRLNSTKDFNFGAQGHEEIERNFYRVHGTPKRFFDEASIHSAFAEWHVLSLEEIEIYRYGIPKVVWEIVMEPKQSFDLASEPRKGLPGGVARHAV